MTKEKVLKIVGVSGVVIGSSCLYFAGSNAEAISGLVGGVFVIIGIVLSFFKKI